MLLILMMTGRVAALVAKQDFTMFDRALPLIGWLVAPAVTALGLGLLLATRPQGSPRGSVAELWMVAMLLSPVAAIATAPIGALLPAMIVHALR